MNGQSKIASLLNDAKKLAKEYRKLTSKPLGITGEIAEFSAATLLHLDLAKARQAGYDACCKKSGKRIQIKGRCLLPNSKPGQRVGSIKLDKDWDAVIMVLLDEDFEVSAIYEALRADIKVALEKSEAKARKRGALSVNEFKKIGYLIWDAADKKCRCRRACKFC